MSSSQTVTLASEKEAKLQEAKEQGRLVDDAILLFRNIVDRMPTTTWLLEAKRLMEAEALPKHEARRQAEAREELDDLQRELRALAVQWVARWYDQGGLYLGREGKLEDFRLLVESLAPAPDGQFAPEALPAAVVAIELMQCAHLVVSDAMKFALSG